MTSSDCQIEDIARYFDLKISDDSTIQLFDLFKSRKLYLVHVFSNFPPIFFDNLTERYFSYRKIKPEAEPKVFEFMDSILKTEMHDTDGNFRIIVPFVENKLSSHYTINHMVAPIGKLGNWEKLKYAIIVNMADLMSCCINAGWDDSAFISCINYNDIDCYYVLPKDDKYVYSCDLYDGMKYFENFIKSCHKYQGKKITDLLKERGVKDNQIIEYKLPKEIFKKYDIFDITSKQFNIGTDLLTSGEDDTMTIRDAIDNFLNSQLFKDKIVVIRKKDKLIMRNQTTECIIPKLEQKIDKYPINIGLRNEGYGNMFENLISFFNNFIESDIHPFDNLNDVLELDKTNQKEGKPVFLRQVKMHDELLMLPVCRIYKKISEIFIYFESYLDVEENKTEYKIRCPCINSIINYMIYQTYIYFSKYYPTYDDDIFRLHYDLTNTLNSNMYEIPIADMITIMLKLIDGLTDNANLKSKMENYN